MTKQYGFAFLSLLLAPLAMAQVVSTWHLDSNFNRIGDVNFENIYRSVRFGKYCKFLVYGMTKKK